MVSLASTEKATGLVAPGVGASLKRKLDDKPNVKTLDSSPYKRPRGTFTDPFDAQKSSATPDQKEKSSELIDEEVRRAIGNHIDGDGVEYNELKGYFSEPPTSSFALPSRVLQKYLVSISQKVSLLDHKCKGLVHAIIDYSWITRDEEFLRIFYRFLRSLLAVHPGYLSMVVQRLVEMFIEPPSPQARHQDDPAIQLVRLKERVHDSLRFILRYVPIASSYLAAMINTTFPFSGEDAETHSHYLREILKVSQYCPEIRTEILSLVIDKVAKLDVQLLSDLDKMDDEMIAEIERKFNTHGVAATDDEDDNESVSSVEDELDEEEEHYQEVQDAIFKLDLVMDILFDYYGKVFERGSRSEKDALLEMLMSQFANIILPMYRSRHAQFLLFHFSQTSPDFINRFTGCCSQLAFDQARPQLQRCAALGYLASFMARGAHVPPETVQAAFKILCSNLEDQRKKLEPSCKGPDLRRYGGYYAIAQALFYIFCYRWRDLIITEDGLLSPDYDIVYSEEFRWCCDANDIFAVNIQSTLNPLRVCAPEIVAQFAEVAHRRNLGYFYPKIEANKRVRLSHSSSNGYFDSIGGRETALSAKRGDTALMLDNFFPFDPYMLPNSKRHLEGDYKEWKPDVAVIDKEAMSESEEEDDED